jgi:putative SOS response-associated peptidase YedK
MAAGHTARAPVTLHSDHISKPVHCVRFTIVCPRYSTTQAKKEWLDPEIHERRALKEILWPCPNEWLTAGEVSPVVNSAKNNGPELLQPAVAGHTENMPQRDLFPD